jgi:hypothetical protein
MTRARHLTSASHDCVSLHSPLRGDGLAHPARCGVVRRGRARAVILSNGTQVPQIMPLGPLQLDKAQREQIRKAVLTEHTEVEFQLPETKPAKDFNPAIGAKLPSGLMPMGMPQGLLAKQPQLADYGYLTMKNQVLIVNAMSNTIVDMFSETQPVT